MPQPINPGLSEKLLPTADQVLAFLRGVGPLDGCYFSEKPAHERGNFWWRKYLAVFESRTPPVEPGDGQIEAGWAAWIAADNNGENEHSCFVAGLTAALASQSGETP